MKRQFLLEALEGYHGAVSKRRRGGKFEAFEDVYVQIGEVIYDITAVTTAEGDTFDAAGNELAWPTGGVALIQVRPTNWRLEEAHDDEDQ